jgi:hypothetical protein
VTTGVDCAFDGFTGAHGAHRFVAQCVGVKPFRDELAEATHDPPHVLSLV